MLCLAGCVVTHVILLLVAFPLKAVVAETQQVPALRGFPLRQFLSLVRNWPFNTPCGVGLLRTVPRPAVSLDRD